jgi:transposase-like protein
MTKTAEGGEARAVRRRRFSAEDKRVLVEEALGTGTSVSAVARRYGISSSLLFAGGGLWNRANWRVRVQTKR